MGCFHPKEHFNFQASSMTVQLYFKREVTCFDFWKLYSDSNKIIQVTLDQLHIKSTKISAQVTSTVANLFNHTLR